MAVRCELLSYLLIYHICLRCSGFQALPVQINHQFRSLHKNLILGSFNPNKWDKDNKDDFPSGIGETAAGAVLGGLLLGPFGALFGAQVGASFGSRRAMEAAQKKEMERLGLTPEMLTMAEEVGEALNRGTEGLKATRDSLASQQSFARRLDNDAAQLYEQAKVALQTDDEEKAKTLLMQREKTLQKLKKVLKDCADEKRRVEQMERNVEALEERAMEVDRLLKRTVGAKSLQDSSSDFMRLQSEDPLLQKFRDLEKM